MPINYDIDDDNSMIAVLTDNGYEVEGNFVHDYSSDESSVYLLSDGNYAKYYTKDCTTPYDWNEMKLLLSRLCELDLTPNIIKFIDIDELSGFIINDAFGDPYSSFKENKEIRSTVIQSLNKLHDCGYIHGDVHMDNILVDKDSHEVRFIDLDNCYHVDDDRLLPYIRKHYNANSINEAKEIELSNIDLEV